MKFFFSCDWGTSTFRLRLVDAQNAEVLSVVKTGHGIASVFESWKQANQGEKNRMAFYQAYLLAQVKKIPATFNATFEDTPIIISGMASSSIGMLELPYKELPFQCSGADLVIHTTGSGGDQSYKMIMISGARTDFDVIRGEETMITGCNILTNDKVQLYIFPGTHSKHITVRNGEVQNLTTYMTGELFDLLSNKSILSASVKKNELEPADGNPYFIEGVKKGLISNLANGIFHVRTNQLFKKNTLPENYHFLSGLLIGYELKDLALSKPSAITLVCSEGLKNAYSLALDVLGLSAVLNHKNADEALVNGQWKILQQLGYMNSRI